MKGKINTPPVPYAQRLKTFSCQGGRLRRGFCFPVYGLAAPASVRAPVIFPRQRAVIESTSNTAGCLSLSLGDVGSPSSMPLRILLPAIGSSGDVNPVIGLGRALTTRGHHVTVITNEYFRDQVAENKLSFIPLGTKAEAEALMGDPRLWHPRKGFGSIIEKVLHPNVPRLYQIIESQRGPGLVVAATTLCLGARVAQEKFGIPTATIHLQPSVMR